MFSMQQQFNLSQLPDNIKIEVAKSDLIAFAQELMQQQAATIPLTTAAELSSDIMTLEAAAKFLNLAPQTIYGHTSNGTIPFIRKGKLYFQKSALEAWLLEGKRKTKAEIVAAAENHIVNRSKTKKGGQHGK
jgi:excisionase family DNA binding protein